MNNSPLANVCASVFVNTELFGYANPFPKAIIADNSPVIKLNSPLTIISPPSKLFLGAPNLPLKAASSHVGV